MCVRNEVTKNEQAQNRISFKLWIWLKIWAQFLVLIQNIIIFQKVNYS